MRTVTTSDRSRTITVEELAAMIDGGAPLRLIDVLEPDHFALVHLPGAENIPRAELDRLAPELLDRDETIVVYCSSADCEESPKAARQLRQLGYRNVFDFEGGIAEWRRRGLPVIRPQHAPST